MEQSYRRTDFPVFIDSGAHGLYNEHVIKKKHADGYKFFESDGFKEYVDKYAAFIKKNKDVITTYANVDVIFNPELSWKTQIYLEKEHGLMPLPVIHFGTDLKWLKRYLKRDYQYIALGGLGQEADQRQYVFWADRAFQMICDQPTRLPLTKVHGFAMTSPKLMARYPWYSVDSTSWIKHASFGTIIMPERKNNAWEYRARYHLVRVSCREAKNAKEIHIGASNQKEIQRLFLVYIEEKGFELGRSRIRKNGNERVIREGLCNSSVQRCALNAMYFLDLAKSMPEWPWPYTKRRIEGFGV